MPAWPRRRPDDLLRVVQRLEARVSGMERRILSLTERSTTVGNQFDQLASDVTDIQSAETGAEGRVAAEVAALQAEIDQLKATNPDIAPQLAGLEAVKARLAALAQPQTPAPTPAPAPAPTPTPAQQTTTTATAVPGQSTFDGQPVLAQTPQPTDAQGNPVPTPAVDTSGQQPAEQPAPTPPPAAPGQGQGPVGQAGT